ncbi:MAG: hypothetical protein ACYTFW_01040 [Planctomycetota bacterium]|jgi:hypothetical protein
MTRIKVIDDAELISIGISEQGMDVRIKIKEWHWEEVPKPKPHPVITKIEKRMQSERNQGYSPEILLINNKLLIQLKHELIEHQRASSIENLTTFLGMEVHVTDRIADFIIINSDRMVWL